MAYSRPITHRPQASLSGLILGILIGGLAVGLWWWLEEPLVSPQKAVKLKQPGISPAMFVKEFQPAKVADSSGAGDPPWNDRGSAENEKARQSVEQGGPALRDSADATDTYRTMVNADGSRMTASYGMAAVVGTSHVHLHAVLPVKPECYPPAELINQFWTEAVLTRTGGVALIGSDSLMAWDAAKPGVVQPLLTPMRVRKLVGTPDEVVMLDDQRRVWRIYGGAEAQMEFVREGCRDLFASGLSGKVVARDASGTLMVLDLRTPGKAEFFKPPQVRSLPDATLSADGCLWVVGGDIWTRDLTGGDWQSVNGRADEVQAMGSGVLTFYDGFLKAHRGAKAPPHTLTQVQMFAAVAGLAVGVNGDIEATAWGDLLDQPASFKIPKGARQMAVSPAGLVAFW